MAGTATRDQHNRERQKASCEQRTGERAPRDAKARVRRRSAVEGSGHC
jgi:hypothetical protein